MTIEPSPEIIDLGLGFSYEYTPEPQPEPVALFNVTERSELAVAAMSSLVEVKDPPKALALVEQGMIALHDTLVSKYEEEDTPDIEPYLNLVLNDKFTLDELIKAFDKNQTNPSFVYDDLWNQYTPDELNRTSLVRNDTDKSAKVTAMLLGGDRDDEPGLHHTNMTLNNQIEAVRGRGQSLVTPAGYIVLNAQRREAGAPLLDRTTYSRFVQLPQKWVVGDRFVGFADSRDGQLRLRGSSEHASPYVGVRLSVG